MVKSKTLNIKTLVICMILIQSCTVAKISGRGAVPIVLNQPSQRMELMEHVRVKKNSNFDWSSSFDVSEVMARTIAEKKPDAVINTTVTIKSGADNFFINLFTLGLAQSRKVVVDADLMKERQ
jgi:hypothetical protein